MGLPRITVFGRIAIVAGLIFVAVHYGLIASTVPYWGDLLIGVLGCVTALGYGLIKAPRTKTVRTLVRVAFVWSGLAFLAGTGFAIQHALQVAGVAVTDGTVWIAILLVAGIGYHRARSPRARLRRVEGTFDGSLRIAHLSDLHLGDIWSRTDLVRVVRRARDYTPDIVVITGDLLDGMEPVRADLLEPLGAFEVPVYFVSGNHDSYTEREALIRKLEEYGVETLEGTIEETAAFSILGIGYGLPEEYETRLVEAFRTSPRPRIVLKHKPSRIESLLEASPDAILCGHVHGGQIWPLGYLARLEFPHVAGSHWIDGTMLHVSEGSATWGPPFRLGTRSEFTVLDFVPASERESLGSEQEAGQVHDESPGGRPVPS